LNVVNDYDCGRSFSLARSAEEDSLDLGVEDEDEGTTGTSDNVGEGALEESLGTFVSSNSLEAVQSAVVHLLLSTGVHHESTSDGIKRIGNDTGADGDNLSEGPHGEDVSILGIREENSLTGIEHTEVRGTISDDTNDRDTETSVETLRTILGKNLLEAVDEAVELTLSTGSDISSETGTGEIKRVDDGEGSGTSSTTGSAVTEEELDWLFLGVVRVQSLLVEVFEGEVESLSREVTNDVGQVTSPEGTETLLFDDSREAVADTVVSIFSLDGGGSILDLQEELNSLDRGYDSLRHSSGDTTDEEIGDEGLLAFTV